MFPERSGTHRAPHQDHNGVHSRSNPPWFATTLPIPRGTFDCATPARTRSTAFARPSDHGTPQRNAETTKTTAWYRYRTGACQVRHGVPAMRTQVASASRTILLMRVVSSRCLDWPGSSAIGSGATQFSGGALGRSICHLTGRVRPFRFPRRHGTIRIVPRIYRTARLAALG